MGFCRRSLETTSVYPPQAEVVSRKCPGFHAATWLEIG